MSDTPMGDGWWQATDGKWYSPEQRPAAAGAATPEQTAASGGAAPSGPDDPTVVDPNPSVPPAGAPADGAAGTEEDGSGGGGKGKVIGIVAVIALIAAAVAGFVLLRDDTDDDASVETTEAVGSDDDDPDIGDATQDRLVDGPIEFDTEYQDALEEDRTEARYTLDAPDGAIMTLEVANDPDSVRPVLVQFTAQGDTFASFRTSPGAEESETIVLNHEGGGPFELAFSEGPAAYTFSVGLEVQSDAGQEGDAGSEFADAFEVGAGDDVSGLLGGEDTTDHFTLEIETGTTFTFSAAVPRDAERAALFVVSFEGSSIFSERVAPGSDTDFDVLLGEDDQGTLDIVVSEGVGTYSFTADFVNVDEGGGPGDAPAELADARSIDPAETLTGSVGDRDSADHYLLTAPSASLTIDVAVSADSARAVLVVLQDASGSNITTFRTSPGAQTTETVEVEAGSELRLVFSEGRGSYEVTFG